MESRRREELAGRERRPAVRTQAVARSGSLSARVRGRRLGRSFLVALIAALGVGPAAFAVRAAAAGAPPSLRLFTTEHRVSLSQGFLRAGVIGIGVWVAPVGGAFQVDLRRPGYGAWTASQVDPVSGASLRPVPVGMVDPAGGLRRFLSVRFLDSRGPLAVQRLFTFCPNGESARVDDTGPLNQTYPGDCFSGAFFPFVRGIVWGIDSGWAVAPILGTFPGIPPGALPPGALPPGVLPPAVFPLRRRRPVPGAINLRPGRYTVIVSIARSYRRLFGIADAGASVKLSVRVLPTRARHGRSRPPALIGPGAGDYAPGPLRAATVTQPDPATLPNLVALPAWAISVHRAGRRELLTFNATIWNAGPAPFSIEGFRRPNSNVMDAYEYFFDSAGNVVGRSPAGTMFYDNQRGHHHWHLRQLASYRLTGPSGQAVRSQKQSFCIAPSDAVDLTLPAAARAGVSFGGPGFGGVGFGGSVCDLYSPDAIWLREQLPVGWGDTYIQSVAGQAIDVTNVPNGRYRIEVRVNPLGQLVETTTADDVAVRFIRLSGRRGRRSVSVSPWHGIRG